MAPEKNVKPRPRRIEANAHPTNVAWICHITRYRRVEASRVTVPSRNEKRRPRVSATTPVGTSKMTWPTAKKAFAANASVLLRPASSRKSVLMPQMNDEASVVSRVSTRYVRWTVRASVAMAGESTLGSPRHAAADFRVR